MLKKALTGLCLLSLLGFSYAADMVKITSPILQAKRVFLYDRCDGCAADAKSLMVKWEKYELVDTLEKADLVFTFTGSSKVDTGAADSNVGVGVRGGSGDVQRQRSSVQLTIFDRKTHEQLFQETQGKVQDWDKPAAELIKDLQKRVEKAEKKK